MAISNHERVGKGLDLLKKGLAPFVEREMKAVHKKIWLEIVKRSLDERDIGILDGKVIKWDVHRLLMIMWENWKDVFQKTLGHAERSLTSELREVRNAWAHQQPFTLDDAYRALDSINRLLSAISAEEARDVEQMKQELLRIRFEEQARRESRRASFAPTEGQPASGLLPWREIVTPHPDVASGKYQQAEFAANLDQVFRNEGSSEYKDPQEFYRRTFLTDGLRQLLKSAILRLAGSGGDPIVRLQTNFGGGKTHSMIALLHLFSGVAPGNLPGVEELMKETQVEKISAIKRAVLVGTALSPGIIRKKKDGTHIRTLWGEMAWQIGGKEGFAIIADADSKGVSPGSDVLRELFTRFGPCLVLIDELVTFVRQLYGVDGLPAGSFDANLSFIQALTEATKQVPNTFVVASIPSSDIEIGGEGGRSALTQLVNIIGRTEAPWRPASSEESFEIVRRRLFQPISNKFVHRDAVIDAFSKLYRDQQQEFPPDSREGEYARRMKAAYPIHPELFDRLYEDWSSLDRFQRTRGVLRLMAAVIHTLWDRNDKSLLIMPANIPIDELQVQSELTRYLEDPWVPVIEKEIDGPNSLSLDLDRDNPNLGRYSACRRVARTIFMGSAPKASTAHPGQDDRNIKLGCVQPGENGAIFGDALRRLSDNGAHLYVDNRRYWYSTQPSVTRLAQDRADQFEIHNVWDELKKRLREDRERGDFISVHAVPDGSGDVPDEMEARLVILGPEYSHARQIQDSPARIQAEKILNERGNSPRLFRNMLIFLAPDRERLRDLEQSIRQYMAWNSIVSEAETLNLDAFQRNLAITKRNQAGETVESRKKETYSWLLVPTHDPKGSIKLEEIKVPGGPESLAIRSSKKLKAEEHLITDFSATRLRMELDKHLWKDVPHLGLKKLWEYFATYLYLPRLCNSNVLIRAIQDGISQMIWTDYFAYAEGWDEEKKRYKGLKVTQRGSVLIDGQSLIVKPDIAANQREIEENEAAAASPKAKTGATISPTTTIVGEEPLAMLSPAMPRRFHGSVLLDPLRISRDASRVAEEVIQHLIGLLGSQVEVTMEIHAEIPEGAPDNIIRNVTENCQTLKFTSHEFEKE